MLTILEILAIVLIFFIIGCGVGYITTKRSFEKKLQEAHTSAEQIISDAQKEAKTARKEILLEAKEQAHNYRAEQEADFKERRKDIQKQEERLMQREEVLDRKDITLDKRENSLETRDNEITVQMKAIEKQKEDLSSLISQQEHELYSIGQLTKEEAQKQIFAELNKELIHERADFIKNSQEEAQQDARKVAKSLIVEAIQRSAADTVSEKTVTTVTLPTDDMKGRIIGKEGRNIRSFESLTGIDLIIDDTPEVVVLSGYDPIRREIARMALEGLIQDGRIHPTRIEEMVDKARQEMDDHIRELGEQAIFGLGIHNMHPDLIKIVGRLNFRTSYGQNVLSHSIEVAKLSGLMAAELNEDETLAKRAGLLHDIGKAIDREVEGSHVEIGVEIATKYKENKVVINTIASHHEDEEPTSLIATIVAAADAISAARPGARSESMENYIHRLEKLEEISNSYKGVDHTYAIQAGREVRVIVKPEDISDDEATILSRDIKNRIENELEYPGHIKVTVIREIRKIEYAK